MAPSKPHQLKAKGEKKKPYDRPTGSSSSLTSSKALVNRGAPSSAGQSSRKGKKAWRRNIDITAEESAMEQEREEERVTGGRVKDQVDEELFTVDTVGDIAVAKAQKTKKPLRSLAILHERSAVPSLPSRFGSTPSSSSSAPARKISAKEKTKLRALAKHALAEADGRGIAEGAVSAVGSVLEDVWDESAQAPSLVPAGGFGEEGMMKRPVKLPPTLRRAKEIREAQVFAGRHHVMPSAGTSYNPTEEAHSILLQEAVTEEMELLKDEEEQAEKIAILGAVIDGRRANVGEEDTEEYAEGMVVGPGEEGDSASDAEEVEAAVIRPSKRKTTAQRNRAARAKEAKRLEEEEKRRQKLAKSVTEVKKLKRAEEKRIIEMQEKERIRKFMKKEKERMGLEGGEKVGKYRVKKGRVDVQLGEDLAESLRQLKPEGNRFRDHFVGLQKKGYIEPREPVQPKRRTLKLKEYEKHPFKRFQ